MDNPEPSTSRTDYSAGSSEGDKSQDTLSSDIWQLKGNICFKGKDYAKAIKYYTNGLNCDPTDLIIRSNRCMAYIKLRCFRRGLEDADKVLAVEPTNPKVVYRKVKALFGLEKYAEAIEFIDQQKDLSTEAEATAGAASLIPPDMLNLDTLLIRAQTFLHQQQTGDYDLAYFLKNHKVKYHECADYVGSVETVVINESKGRGLRATKDIKKGELVIVSKAVCIFYERDKSGLLAKLAETQVRLKLEPELLTEFYNLYAGPELKYISLPPSLDDSARARTRDIDPERLEKIFVLNHFTNKPQSGCFYDIGSRPGSKGLWYYPSFINHSCYDACNCYWTVFGDVMLIRATRDIFAGEELHISYCKSIGISYKEKIQTFQRFGFNCNCSFCQWDKADEDSGLQEERKQLLHQLKSCGESSDCMLPIIEQLEKTFEGPNQNRMYLVDPYFDLGLIYSDEDDYTKAAENMIKAYELIKGTSVGEQFTLILLWNIIGEFLNGREIGKAEEWVALLKEETLIVLGPNAEFVLRTVATDFITYLLENRIQF